MITRGAKVGGRNPPPNFGRGVEPPLIFRIIYVEIVKSGPFWRKILKSRPFLIALRRIAKKWTFLMRKNS